MHLTICPALFKCFTNIYFFNSYKNCFYYVNFPEAETEVQRDKVLNQGHTASKWQSWDSNSGSLAPEFYAALSMDSLIHLVIHSFIHSCIQYVIAEVIICARPWSRMIHKTRPSLCPHGVHSPGGRY